MNRLIFCDALLTSLMPLVEKTGGPSFQLKALPESYVSGEVESSSLMKIFASLPMALTYTKEDNIWIITPRSQSRSAPPRFVSLDEVSQGRVQLPLVAGAPRRAAAVLLGERPLALLETGKLPALQRQVVAEGDLLDGFRVSRIERAGIVLQKGERSFLVPLVPFNPIL